MAVIWGLDLNDMAWSKFKSSYMFKNRDYHLRRTKFVVYQLAMIFTVVSESLGTAVLSDYVDQQKTIQRSIPGESVLNNDYIGIASYNIFVGIYVATIFGAAFFFDLFWPVRHESPAVKTAWRICSVLACVFTLSCALPYTYIVATRQARLVGPSQDEGLQVVKTWKGGVELVYRRNARAVASVVCLWVGLVATFASTFIMWRSLAYIDAHGPLSAHARGRDDAVKPDEEKLADRESAVDESALPTQPAQTHMPAGERDAGSVV